MHQYLFDQTLTDNLNSKQMRRKLEQVPYYIKETPLLQNQMAPKNRDQDDQLDFIPRNSPKLNKTTPSMTENSWELCVDYVAGLISSKGRPYPF